MSSYQQLQSFNQNGTKYAEFTKYTEKDYLPYPHVGFASQAIHVGSEPEEIHGSVNVPIHLSTTYAQPEPGMPKSRFDYTRCGNPTREAFEKCIAALEYGKFAHAYCAGVAAMTAVLHQLNAGDHIVCCDDVYGGTQRYLRNFTQPKHLVEVDFVDTTIVENVKKAFKKNTKLLWLETPTNPTLKVSDIKALAAAAHEFNKEIIVVVDNTFLTPYLQSPLLLGADVVVHSASKYIGGHSDIIMGVTVTNDEVLHSKLFMAAKSFGGNPSPFDCYLALRGLKTLEARVRLHCYNGFCLSKFLEKHPRVEKVFYSGLPSHPAYELIQQQQRGFGGMVSFQLKGGLEEAKKFLQILKIFTLAESLGGVESLAELPAVMTHGSVPKEHRDLLGITEGFIRLSVGIEDINDIIADVERALELAFIKE